MKKPLGLKYTTMNNHFVKGQRVPSKKYKDNYDMIKWEKSGVIGRNRDLEQNQQDESIPPL